MNTDMFVPRTPRCIVCDVEMSDGVNAMRAQLGLERCLECAEVHTKKICAYVVEDADGNTHMKTTKEKPEV